VYTFEHMYYEFEVNPFRLPSASEVDGGAELNDQTSTTSKLVEQLHSSLTEAAEEYVEEYRPVSRYLSPND